MNKTLIMKLAKVMAKFSEVTTDKGTLTTDGELEVGVEVYVEGEDGFEAAPDGEYETDDKIIVVADGKISEIREKEKNEDEPVEEPIEEDMAAEEPAANPVKERFDAVKAKFEATYQEVQNNIYSALADAGIYGYLVENTNEYAVVSVWGDDEQEHLYRYSISIDENGYVTLGEMTEVHVEYVEEKQDEPSEDTPAEEEFDKDAKIAELEAKLAALEKPVEEPVNLSKTTPEAEDKSYNKALKYFK